MVIIFSHRPQIQNRFGGFSGIHLRRQVIEQIALVFEQIGLINNPAFCIYQLYALIIQVVHLKMKIHKQKEQVETPAL